MHLVRDFDFAPKCQPAMLPEYLHSDVQGVSTVHGTE